MKTNVSCSMIPASGEQAQLGCGGFVEMPVVTMSFNWCGVSNEQNNVLSKLLVHLEHVYSVNMENRLHPLIAYDFSLVFRILEPLLLDVVPYVLHHLGARELVDRQQGSQRFATASVSIRRPNNARNVPQHVLFREPALAFRFLVPVDSPLSVWNGLHLKTTHFADRASSPSFSRQRYASSHLSAQRLMTPQGISYPFHKAYSSILTATLFLIILCTFVNVPNLDNNRI